MSWFGGWGSSRGSGSGPASGDTSVTPTAEDAFDSSSFDEASSLARQPTSGGPGDQEALQRLLAAEQQRVMVQAVMFRLTDMSFEQCVASPGTALSSSERSCIAAMTNKYIEASELIKSKTVRS